MNSSRHKSSFRDPSGYVFVENGILYRHVNQVYQEQYNQLKNSGFYNKLFDNNLLIPHVEVSSVPLILRPEKIPFISYPYEWSFTQYKHAALHTLKVQKICLQNDFTLKDATAFNITFDKGKPIFIDTLSFDFYNDGEPWRAYKQFIIHFLVPLVLAKYYGTDMLRLLQQYIDGVPLQKAVRLLPLTARFNPVLYTNIYLTAKYDKKYSGDKTVAQTHANVSKASQIKIIEALYDYIKNIGIDDKTEWRDYYNVANYNDESFIYKKQLVREWCLGLKPESILDAGGNDGTFSRCVSDIANKIVVSDIDVNAVDKNYIKILENGETNILPIVADLLNPSPGLGFENNERQSLPERIIATGFDITFALALIHHVSLSGNVPFDMSAKMFASWAPYLIIEFPDREDSWVSFLLESKREFIAHFDFYNKANFESEYSHYFDIVKQQQIPGTHRTMYLLKRKDNVGEN